MDAVLCGRKVFNSPPAHLQAGESYDYQEIEQLAASFAQSSEMDIEKIGEPGDGGPGLLRVPIPIMSPSLLRPEGTGEHSESEEGKTDIYKSFDSGVEVGAVADKSPYGKDECTSEDGI